MVMFEHAKISHPKPKNKRGLIIAIDLCKFNSMACIYDSETQEQQLETLATFAATWKSLSWSAALTKMRGCGRTLGSV